MKMWAGCGGCGRKLVVRFRMMDSVALKNGFTIVFGVFLLGMLCLALTLALFSRSPLRISGVATKQVSRGSSSMLLPGKVHNATDFEPNNMEVVHVAQICHNGLAVQRLVSFVKSLLLFRTTPIFMHILTNEATQYSLREIFRTWGIPYFEIQLYVRPDIEPETSWIPFIHHAGMYAFKKLLMEDIIRAADRVLFYDCDIILTGDIYDLWKLFLNFDYEQSIGIAYETQFWYRSTDGERYEHAWPAISWGFNTGLVMYDLRNLRRIKWKEIWNEVARQELQYQGFAWLAEQDIINAVFVKYRRLLYIVPCIWNVQFGPRFNLESCPYVRKYKGFHATSERLSLTSPDDVPILRRYWNLINTLTAMNGGVFKHSSTKTHRLFPYFGKFGLDIGFQNDSISVTAVLYANLDGPSTTRSITDAVNDWEGPMSIAIGGHDKDLSLLESLPMRSNVGYHYVFRNPGEKEISKNLLKVVAIRNVHTSHFMIGEIGFRMRKQTANIILKELSQDETVKLTFPVFESTCSVTERFRNKEHLGKQVNEDKIKILPPLNSEICKKWINAKTPLQVTWLTHHDTYVVVQKKLHPLFNDENHLLDYEEMTTFDDWLIYSKVTVLPNCVALKLSTPEETIYKNDYDIVC